MKKSIKYSVLFFLLTTIGYSCSESSSESGQETETPNEFLTISKSQYQKENMQLGEIEMFSFEEIIRANGRLTASPDGVAEVNTHVSGVVNATTFSVGDFVKKGQVICSIEGNEVIKIQQEYLETSAQLKNMKADYERLKILSKENISSQKELSMVESNYKTALARYNSLKAQLELLNLDASKVEDGNISSSIQITAPISGYVAIQNCTLGQFVDSQKMLMKIVDTGKLQLAFYVFEKDILKLNTSQAIRFYSPDAKSDNFTATLTHIGKSIDPENKTIKCLAKLDKPKAANFVDGMFMMTEIISNEEEITAIPDEALLKSGDDFYLLSKEKEDEDNFYFKKIKVKTGISQRGYTAVEVEQEAKHILIRGVYNLIID